MGLKQEDAKCCKSMGSNPWKMGQIHGCDLYASATNMRRYMVALVLALLAWSQYGNTCLTFTMLLATYVAQNYKTLSCQCWYILII